MRSLLVLSPVLSLLVTAACGSPRGPTAASGPPAAGGDDCPMQLAGTRVTAADLDGGVAIVLTTTGDVDALRARVRAMASRHDQMSAMRGGAMAPGSGAPTMMGHGPMGHGPMGGGAPMAMMAAMPPSHAVTADVDGGERVTLTPTDPAQLDALRAAVRGHVAMMQGGACPMMPPAGG